jgi:hypothetical protein
MGVAVSHVGPSAKVERLLAGMFGTATRAM